MSACRVLFVSNGHGEIAIASRIACELPRGVEADHVALVGSAAPHDERLHDVGPRRVLPSGGLIAMGNVRNLARDVRAGLPALTFSQWKYLRGVAGRYDAAVAVGDVFALLMTYAAHARTTIYVGTAKSVHVAKYGAFERRLIARAGGVFVRDEATARALREDGIAAAAANVIVDLHAPLAQPPPAPFAETIALFPGSRQSAYADAERLAGVFRELAPLRPHAGAVLSVAPSLESGRMAEALERAGWAIEVSTEDRVPFVARDRNGAQIRAWRGSLDAMLAWAAIVVGQAGTANEAAAAAGIPVVAYDQDEKPAWYRRRQIGLLGDAMLVVRGTANHAAREIAALLDDAVRRATMGAAGRARMGPPGGAAAIAAEIVRSCA